MESKDHPHTLRTEPGLPEIAPKKMPEVGLAAVALAHEIAEHNRNTTPLGSGDLSSTPLNPHGYSEGALDAQQRADDAWRKAQLR